MRDAILRDLRDRWRRMRRAPGTSFAVISERLWARVFGSDPQAVGERTAVDGIEVAIVGIAAANPDGLDPESLTDLHLPLKWHAWSSATRRHKCAHGTWSGGLPTA